MSASAPRDDDLVRAYLAERESYARRGMTDRVAQVDAELKRLGYTRATAKPAKERAVKPRGETRG